MQLPDCGRRRVPLAVGAAVVLAGSGGAAAAASLAAAGAADPTVSGNASPIDDNHGAGGTHLTGREVPR